MSTWSVHLAGRSTAEVVAFDSYPEALALFEERAPGDALDVEVYLVDFRGVIVLANPVEHVGTSADCPTVAGFYRYDEATESMRAV